jgi:RNA polymerase sigma-70 factor (ECF subfamily)
MQQHVENDDEIRDSTAEELFHHHAPAIFAFLRQQTSSREDAEDLLLEVFTAVLRQKHLSRLPLDQQTPLIWRIVRNKLIDAYRRSTRRASISVELVMDELFADSEQAPEQMFLRLEEYAQLHALFQKLAPLQQKILCLRFVNGMRSPQIAELVGKSEAAVRAMISRTLNQLRTLYREGEK